MVTTTLMLLGLVVGDRYVPEAPLEVKAYQRVSDAEFRLMRKEAEEFAAALEGLGLVVSSRDAHERYFELQADGQPVMLVDNSSVQLVVVIAGESRARVPELRELQQYWRVRTRPDWWRCR